MALISTDAIAQFQACLALAPDVTRHLEAHQLFAELQSSLAIENPLAAELLALAWKDVIAARRSAAFWEQISDVERDMSEQMVATHTNLQQNYLRLMQEL
ncbi:MAG: hypothetical protein KME15_02435 [Drouetiella hepatica Uher 2000/2452]|jgi:hypothetical protein|uniref:Uncharacterized protein n=1 Tax=Drouetiella hepatica Uher 2000/2452 TaxID=904376 RepID=A0A951Q7E1_9CYAN|nr:hypothetical protein [Drouetiella hepatica Uher 2000/2452]